MRPEKANMGNVGKAIAIYFGIAFLVLFVGSQVGSLMRDGLCLPYLGCNSGFFGYDALMHLASGVALGGAFAWALRGRGMRFEKSSLWKEALVAVALVALAGVLWEIVEFGYDHVRMVVLHIDLLDPMQLAQPTNADTMGDLAFGVLGGLLGSLASLYRRHD